MVEVVADLRTGQIRTTVPLEAPRDGGATKRVNWILRQLGAAPGGLTVEVLFARREQTSCEQLKDIRDRPAALLPDPAAGVRSFRLTLCSPLGTKRNGLRNGFIPSVNAAVDAFYAEVVQALEPSAAPKLPADVAEEAIAAVESSQLRVIGQLYDSAVPTDKFSATVDAELLAAVRAHAGPRGVSAFVAAALRHELDRVRLRELLDDLAADLGPPDEAMVAEATRELNALLSDADGGRRAG